jgi:hypothetical protein
MFAKETLTDRKSNTCPWCTAPAGELVLDGGIVARSCPRCRWWWVGSNYKVMVRR